MRKDDDARSALGASMLEVVMESHGESLATIDHGVSPSAAHWQLQTPPVSPVVRVRIERVQLVAATSVVAAAIAVLVCSCAGDGVRLETFESSDKDEPARKRLLDKYNAISGNVVSVLVKPLEYFIATVLALALLSFATTFALSSRTTRYHHSLLALTAATGYLITNAFNAINVQLAPLPIRAVLSAQDLSLTAAADATSVKDYADPKQKRAGLVADVVDRSLLEETEGNPLANTIFRNWMLPPEFNLYAQCAISAAPTLVAVNGWGGVSALYRFLGQSWRSDALPTALTPAKSLKFVAENPTLAARVVSGVGVDTSRAELPMPQTLAVRLAVDAVYNAERVFKAEWAVSRSEVESRVADILWRHRATRNYQSVTDALLMDAPRDQQGRVSDAAVLQVMANMTLATFSPKSIRGPSVAVELSHLDISSDLAFDAITIEFASRSEFLQRRLMANASAPFDDSELVEDPVSANSSSGGDRYYELDANYACSLSACALVDKTSAVKPHVVAFRGCDAQDDSLQTVYRHPEYKLSCKSPSDNSMVVVSVGTRIEGDEILLGSISNGTATREIVRLKNARKVYSLTVGQLSWKTQDLAALYGAECAGGDQNMCRGIRYILGASKGGRRKHVLVSSKRVPLNGLYQYLYDYNFDKMPLLQLIELPPTNSDIMTDGDMVLPRRFAKSSLPRAQDDSNRRCSADVENYVYHMEKNHLYIEKSLQPAYAAAVFFLFQEGVAREEDADAAETTQLAGSGGGEATGAANVSRVTTLAFLHNKQGVDVRLSTPWLNTAFTLAGAAALLVTAIVVAVTSAKSENMLDRLADAHNVVEMLVDTTKYPPVLLKKTFSGTSEGAAKGNGHQSDDDGEIERGAGQQQAAGPAKPTSGLVSAGTSAVLLDEKIRVRRAVLESIEEVGTTNPGSVSV